MWYNLESNTFYTIFESGILNANNDDKLIGNSFVRIFPNPANESVSISFPMSKQTQISVFSSNGSKIFTVITNNKEFFEFKVASFSLSQGVYFIEVLGEFGKVVKTLFIS